MCLGGWVSGKEQGWSQAWSWRSYFKLSQQSEYLIQELCLLTSNCISLHVSLRCQKLSIMLQLDV